MPRYVGLLVVHGFMYSLAVYSSISVGIGIGKKLPPENCYLWFLGASFVLHAVLSSSHALLMSGNVQVAAIKEASVPLPSPHIAMRQQAPKRSESGSIETAKARLL